MFFKDNSNDIKQWLYSMNINNFMINDDLTIDIDGNLDLVNCSLCFLPVTFNKVSGNVLAQNNFFTTLRGFPCEIGGNLDIKDNDIDSFFGLNKNTSIGGYVDCSFIKNRVKAKKALTVYLQSIEYESIKNINDKSRREKHRL